jgi:streptomycin 6-kinase
MIKTYGTSAKAWLHDLPNITLLLSELWNLHDLKVHENLSFNYVLDGFQNDKAIILKIGIDQRAVSNEAAALTAFQDHGVVKLLAEDLSQGALLLEKLTPGQTLKNLFPHSDALAIDIACDMIEQLHGAPIPANNNFPTLSQWFQVIDKDWDLPQQYLSLARSLKNTLLNSPEHDVLLHGDLHFDNILSNKDKWVVIDPKGVIGNPIYDKIGCLLREPLVELLQVNDIYALLNTRIKVISQHSKLDPQAILDWTYLQTVMAICWCLEDNQDTSKMLKFLEVIAALRMK